MTSWMVMFAPGVLLLEAVEGEGRSATRANGTAARETAVRLRKDLLEECFMGKPGRFSKMYRTNAAAPASMVRPAGSL